MSLFRYNHHLLFHLRSINHSRLIIPTHPSTIIIRHATEIRSRKPIQTDSKTKQRKNTVNPIAQVKKLGDKAGKMDFITSN
jgi:hypothetical protein